MKTIWILISIFIFIISIQGVDADTVISYGDGWTHYIYDDETHAHKLAPNNYLRWDGEWRPAYELNVSSGDWPYLVEDMGTYYFITRLDDSLTLSKTYRVYDFQPYKIGVTLSLTPSQLNGISIYHNVVGEDYWYILIPQSLKDTSKHLNWDNKLPIISNETGFILNQSDNVFGKWIPNYKYENTDGKLRLYYNQVARSFGIASTEITFDFNSYIINGSAGWVNTLFENTTTNPNNIVIGTSADYFSDASIDITKWNYTASNVAINQSNLAFSGNARYALDYNSSASNYNMTFILNSSDGNISSPVGWSVWVYFYRAGTDITNQNTEGYSLWIRPSVDTIHWMNHTGSGNSYISTINPSLPGKPITVTIDTSTTVAGLEIYIDGVKTTFGSGNSAWSSGYAGYRAQSATAGDEVWIDNHRISLQNSGNVTHWHDAGSGYQTASFIINMTTPTNTNYTVWYANNGSSFSQIGGTYTDNQTLSVSGTKYQNTDLRIVMNGNTTATPEEIEVTFVTETSLLPPQNLSNVTGQTQICYNWDDYVSADYWNISQRIPSIPYTDVNIILDGVKDSEFTDRAHTWILDSPNPTGTNGDKESISWIRNSTTLSGYADGEDDDDLNNDDSFTVMMDMTGDGLTADDRQFILSEGGIVTAKRGPSWLPQATNAVGVVIGAGVAGNIQYEMQIPISELNNFNNGSTIKIAMAREDTSQNPDVIKYYPKTLINDTDPTIWASINLTAESEYTFLGNTTLSNYTVTGLIQFTWYRHRFSTINGSAESSYVYSNDITEDSPQYTVSGYILTGSGSPISGATVWSVCDCGCVCEVETSNATGYYQGDCFYNGTYTIYAIATGYLENSTVVIVAGANRSNQNITLTLTPSITVSPAPPVQYDELDLPLLLYIFIISFLYLFIVFRNGIAATELSMIYLLFIFFMLLFQTISLSMNYIYISAFIFLFQVSITGINLERKGGD